MLVAVSYHLVARTQSCMGDFRSALQNEKETYTIYKIQVLIYGFGNKLSKLYKYF
jgi:protein TIF31